MSAAIGLDYFKDFLGIAATNVTQDARLQIYLDQSWAATINEIGRDIVQTTYPAAPDVGKGDSGYYSGTGTRFLRLRQRPAIETSFACYVDQTGRWGENPDGSFASATLLTYGTDYGLVLDGCLPGTSTKCSYAGILQRFGTAWPASRLYEPGQVTTQRIAGAGNIKVAYTAGWPTIPYDLRSAVCQIAAYVRRNADKGGAMTSESLGGYSYSMAGAVAAGAVPEMGSIRQVLAKYKELAI